MGIYQLLKLVIEYEVLQQFKPFLLGYCNCGCGRQVGYHRNKQNKLINNHQTKGTESPGWKGGRYRNASKYWRIHLPNYQKADKQGYVYEHIYIYEQYHKCCVLKWTEIHHIDGNPQNNDISNLQSLFMKDHNSIHKKGNRFRRGKHIDTSDRICFVCKSKTTAINKPKGINKTPYPSWNHLPWDKINWYCDKCYQRLMYHYRNDTNP
jgi:hypothetical protein